MSESSAAVRTVSERVLAMRDDFVELVGAFNAAHDFETAADAQLLVVALNKFEDDHDLTQIAWPPSIDGDGDLAQPEERR